MKIKYACGIAAIALSTTIVFHDVKAEELPKAGKGAKSKNLAVQREERVYILMRKAAAYPVTDVAGCIGGVKFATLQYADLLRQGALQNEEYTKFSIETGLQIEIEIGTPVDMNAFWITFELLRTNSASWAEVSENGGMITLSKLRCGRSLPASSIPVTLAFPRLGHSRKLPLFSSLIL